MSENGKKGVCPRNTRRAPTDTERRYDCQGNLRPTPNNTALHRLQALDFSIVDTVLYLDAYPDSREALQHYHKLLAERDALLRTRSEHQDMPITHYENASHDHWSWIENPWPWEYGAN